MSLFLAPADADVLATVCSAPKGAAREIRFDSKHTSITRCNWRPKPINPEVDHGSPRRLRWPAKKSCLAFASSTASGTVLEGPLQEPGFSTGGWTAVGRTHLLLAGLACAAPWILHY